jgi:hypothetical protein
MQQKSSHHLEILWFDSNKIFNDIILDAGNCLALLY